MIRPRSEFPLSVHVAAYMIIIALGVLFLSVGKHIFIPLAFGGLVSLLLYPLCRFLEDNGFPRILAIIVTFIICVLFISGISALLWSQVASFVEQLPDLEERTRAGWREIQYFAYDKFRVNIISWDQLTRTSVIKVMDSGALILSGSINIFGELFTFLGLVPVYIFLMLLYRSAFRDFFMFITPMSRHKVVRRVIYQIQKVVQNYIVGLITVMGIVAVLNVLGLYLVGSKYPMFFGVLAATLMIIPYIGLIVGALLPAVYALLMTGSYQMPIAVLVVMSVVQFLEGNFITPYVTGSKVKVNALAAIVGLVVWGYIWGTAGLVIAMPFVAITKVIFDNIKATKHLGFLLGTEIYASSITMPGYFRKSKKEKRHPGDATPESQRNTEREG